MEGICPLCPVAPVIDFVFPVITTYNSLIYIIHIAIRCWLVVLTNSENMNVNWDHEMPTYYGKIKINVLFQSPSTSIPKKKSPHQTAANQQFTIIDPENSTSPSSRNIIHLNKNQIVITSITCPTNSLHIKLLHTGFLRFLPRCHRIDPHQLLHGRLHRRHQRRINGGGQEDLGIATQGHRLAAGTQDMGIYIYIRI